MAAGDLHRFGLFELDLRERTLRRDGVRVPLQDLPFRLLAELVARPGALVSRDELRRELWGPDVHLDFDTALNTAVRRVREALGDDAASPRYVATVPRRGYRFIAPVERRRRAPAEGAPAAPEPPRRRPWGLLAAALVAGAALALGGVWLLGRTPVPGGPPAPSADLPAPAVPGSAEDLYREARLYADRRSREGLEKAIAAYGSALARAPGRPEAYSGLASAYALLGFYDFWRPREAFGPAETMAARALELDPESAEAHRAMGLVRALAHWDWEGAASHLERAAELAPGDPETLLWRGTLLSCLGRHGEALAELERALEREPASPLLETALGWHLFLARRFEEAAAHTRRATELAPGFYDAWDNLKWIQIRRGEPAAALAAWARAEAIDAGPEPDRERRWLRAGLEEMLRVSVASKLERLERGRYQSPYDLVLDYTALGERDAALDWLERSLAERETDLVGLRVDPRLDPLRGEPRFAAVVAAVDLPPADATARPTGPSR